MLDYLFLLLFRLFSLLIRILPTRANYYLGTGFGSLVYHLLKGRQKVTEKNIKRAIGGILSPEEISRLTRTVYKQMGLMLIEFIMLKDINQDNFRDFVRVEDEHFLKDSFAEGKGVILYGAHFGNWEWMGIFISLMGYPVNAIARKVNYPLINEEIEQMRRNKGVKLIPKKGMSIRQAFQCLKKGECLFLLGDQDAGSRGWETTFFGQEASTFAGVVQLAQRTGAAIVPTFLIREEWGEHRLVFHQPIHVDKNADRKRQQQVLQRLTDILEDVISKHPEQWLWLHRRWKTYR